MKKILFILILLNNYIFSAEWSRNNIFKITAIDTNFIADYEDIIWSENTIKIQKIYGWLYSKPVEVSQDLILDNAFINIKSGTVKVKAIDYNSDEIIGEKILHKSGIIDLKDKFRKNLYFSIESLSEEAEIFSFGLKAKKNPLLKKENLIITPEIIFFGEEKLLIKFTLGKPAYIDILVLNKDILVDRIAKNIFRKNGEIVIEYNISQNDKKFLKTGTHFIYIKAITPNNEIDELSTPFYFVKD
ncbi:MAG: hypothetical protein N2258_01045 [Brevinematales bacterium]|nr:hypothetical protein [Brevinematales bacterium]